MAQPTYQNAGSLASGGTVNITPSIPTGYQTNDIIIALLATRGAGVTWTVPSGWNALKTENSSTISACLMWRRVPDGTHTPQAFTASAVSSWHCGVNYLFRGVNVFEPTGGSLNTPLSSFQASSTNYVSNAFTSSLDECLLCNIFVQDDNVAWTNVAWTSRSAAYSSYGLDSGYALSTYGSVVNNTDIIPATTLRTTTTAENQIAFTFTLVPPLAGPIKINNITTYSKVNSNFNASIVKINDITV